MDLTATAAAEMPPAQSAQDIELRKPVRVRSAPRGHRERGRAARRGKDMGRGRGGVRGGAIAKQGMNRPHMTPRRIT